MRKTKTTNLFVGFNIACPTNHVERLKELFNDENTDFSNIHLIADNVQSVGCYDTKLYADNANKIAMVYKLIKDIMATQPDEDYLAQNKHAWNVYNDIRSLKNSLEYVGLS